MVLNLNTAPDMLLGYAVDFVGVTGVPATCGNNEIFTMGIYYGTMDLLSQQLRPLSKGADAVASKLVDGRARGLRARPRLLISISRAHLSSQPPTAASFQSELGPRPKGLRSLSRARRPEGLKGLPARALHSGAKGDPTVAGAGSRGGSPALHPASRARLRWHGLTSRISLEPIGASRSAGRLRR